MTTSEKIETPSTTGNAVLWALLAIIGIYIAAVVAGYPQYATQLASATHDEHTHEQSEAAEQATVEQVGSAPPYWQHSH